ncbi:MAG: hypothetical protein COV35_01120 [Alphaproteobacteria bacterium CG11_big_fil_rev_8_21_14_0_20_39_49]|nr:MAG: hypothetical protein COV35_01120 [Alphaproteobacteria bacterium CG11_big_fil_rev_8_21_14_0_20_39_49]
MKYIIIFVLLAIPLLLHPNNAIALGGDYVVVVYELDKIKRIDQNSEPQSDNKETGQNISVKQDIHIESGSFKISLLSGDYHYSDVRQYNNKLTRINERGNANKWKYAIKTTELNEQIHQMNMQEMLRQLNSDEEANSSDNRERNILGWTVRIQEDLLKENLLQARALRELQSQLLKIRNRVPYRAMKQLQTVSIFLYKEKGGVDPNVTAYYSPLYKAVVFHNAEKLQNLSDRQNAVVLHELAHGYHDIVLSYDNPQIKDAYNNAVKNGLYTNVKTQNGGIASKAYALENHVEYFAELSETYFSRKYGSFENDYYPFNIYDLKKYDNVGYKLAEEMWGK